MNDAPTSTLGTVLPFERAAPMVRRQQADRSLNGTLTWTQQDLVDADLELDRPGARSFTTGVEALDALTCGLTQGSVTVIAAKTGAGKSSFALTTALTLSLSEAPPVLYVSLEMPKEQMALRTLAWMTGISQTRLMMAMVKRVTLQDDERQAISVASRFKRETLRMMAGDFTIDEIRAEAAKLQAEHGLSLVICDHVGLVKEKPGNRENNRERHIASASRGLKMLAMELNVAVLNVAQMNRGADKEKTPELWHIRESSAIAQDASNVLFLWDAENGAADRRRIFVRKNRYGFPGMVEVPWDGACGRIGDCVEALR